MVTKQLTKYNDSPTFSMLSESDQKAYLQDGTITPVDDTPPSRGWKQRGRGAAMVNRALVDMWLRIFLANHCAPIKVDSSTPMLAIKSRNYGLIKIEVFRENFLIECQEMFYTDVALRLLECGQQIEVIGERHFISVTRRKNEEAMD